MTRRRRFKLHIVINAISSAVLCLTLGRVLFVLRARWWKNEAPQVQHSAHGDASTTRSPHHPWRPRVRHDDQLAALPTERERGRKRPDVRYSNPRQSNLDMRAAGSTYVSSLSMVPKAGGSGLDTGAARLGRTSDNPPVRWASGWRVLIFTMDSLQSTVARAATGGPAGEILIRKSLTEALAEAGAKVEVAVSDDDFRERSGAMKSFDAIVLDPWTWAGRGWTLKPQLRGQQHKMFILDFFGADKPHVNLGVPPSRHLTAFPVPPSQARTFLGYWKDSSVLPASGVVKKRQGVIWGKSKASFESRHARSLVTRLADFVELHSTVAPRDAMIRHKNIVYHGMLSHEKWSRLLQESKFMIGLGDPLSGPSAVDAVAAGCVYLNPVYRTPFKKIYTSQHPFLEDSVGPPYVCSFPQRDAEAALDCARKAVEQDLEPMIPQDLTKQAYANRLMRIFQQF